MILNSTACILNDSCVVEKPGQRRKIETCPDDLALVLNAVAEPSNKAAVSDSYLRGATHAFAATDV